MSLYQQLTLDDGCTPIIHNSSLLQLGPFADVGQKHVAPFSLIFVQFGWGRVGLVKQGGKVFLRHG